MSYTAMILLITAIFGGLLGFSGQDGPVIEIGRFLALASLVLLAVVTAVPYLRRLVDDSDEA